jgi:hypothetical protein
MDRLLILVTTIHRGQQDERTAVASFELAEPGRNGVPQSSEQKRTLSSSFADFELVLRGKKLSASPPVLGKLSGAQT